jgi:hypothetical protein
MNVRVMTWKSYAAVSGATVLAGWLASSPPENAPATAALPARPPASRPDAAADIQVQAQRLQARLQVERDYAVPQRNLFRFEEGGDVAPDYVERGTAFEPDREPDAAPIEEAVPVPVITLSGIAEDQSPNGDVSRTAVLSAPSGVELVREGDQLLGYRVARIESDAVELVRVADGSSRRLTLRR